MPNETPLPPPQAYTAQGTFTPKQKKWIYAGIIGLVFLLMVFSAHSTTTQPPVKKQAPSVVVEEPKPEPPKHLLGGAQPVATQVVQPQPQMVNPYAQPMYYQPQQPPQPAVDEAAKREQASAFSDSIVRSPQPPPAAQEHTQTQDVVVQIKPHQTLPEGTIISGTLENRLNGDFSGPVKVLIATDVYLPGTQQLVIPQGAEVLGETQKVTTFGQSRLAVSFHRIIWPGHSLMLDKVPGLDQVGATALKDKVDNHYASIFGASLAIGAIGGLAQIGNYGSYGYDSGTQFRNGVTQSMAQSSDRILDRFLNRMPTVTIREGTRVDVYLTGDLEIPE